MAEDLLVSHKQENGVDGSVREKLRECFGLIDTAGNGCLSLEDLNVAFKDTSGVAHGMLVDLLSARCENLEKISYDEWENVFEASDDAGKHKILRFCSHVSKKRRGAVNPGGVVAVTSARRCRFQPVCFHSPLRMLWDVGVALLLVYIAIAAPYFHAFEPSETSICYGSLKTRTTTKIDLFIDICFIVDILLNFVTTYADKRGDEVTDPYRIGVNYLKTWFALDAISTIPLDCISSGMPVNLQPAKLLKLSKMTKAFRFARLSKVVKLSHGSSLAESFDDFFIQSSVQFALKLFKIFFSSAVICHWLACLMAISGSGFLENYVEDGKTADTWNPSRRYFASLYWAVTTMTTVGFGDIVPNSDSERAATMLAMVLGGGFYGFVIAEMSSIVVTRDVKTRRFYEKLDTVGAWLEHHELPVPYRERVLRYLREFYRRRTALDEHAILDDLSPDLREELTQHLLPEAVVRNTLFESLPNGTLAHLTPIIFTTFKNTGDYVVRTGYPGEGMFVIASGKALLWGDDCSSNPFVARQLDEGDSFGEKVLLGVERFYSYTVEATSPLEMHTIPTEEFLRCFKCMPDILARIRANLIGANIDNSKQVSLANGIGDSESTHSGLVDDAVAIQSVLVDLLPQISVMIAKKLSSASSSTSSASPLSRPKSGTLPRPEEHHSSDSQRPPHPQQRTARTKNILQGDTSS